MANEHELAVPEEVVPDAKSVEVLRACVANGGLVCALRPTTWDNPAAWGIVLADAARHVANAVRDEKGIEPFVSVAQIREMFNGELAKPADEPTGNFVK